MVRWLGFTVLFSGCDISWKSGEDGDTAEGVYGSCEVYWSEESVALDGCLENGGDIEQVVVENWSYQCALINSVLLEERLGTEAPCTATVYYNFETAPYGDTTDWLRMVPYTDGYWWMQASVPREAYDDFCEAGHDCTLANFGALVTGFTYYQ